MTETEEIAETVTATEDCLSDLIDALSDDPSMAAASSDANTSASSQQSWPGMDAMPDLISASTPCIDTLLDTSVGYAIPDIFQEPSLTEQPLEALDEEPAYLTWHKTANATKRGGVHLTNSLGYKYVFHKRGPQGALALCCSE